jgi:hypothetical protein
LELNRIVSNCQHGFQQGRSTETQLISSLDSWTKSLDEKLNVDVVYLDFSRAFDSVSHPKLLAVLQKIGIQGNLFNWLREFLSNRTQRVVINGKLSNVGTVTSGIGQGTVTGPVLFNIYINDLPTVVSNLSTVFLYADDCKISFPYRMASETKQLQTESDKISAWANDKQLKFAAEKCAYITLGCKTPGNHGYVLDGQPLQKVPSIKDLGMTIDSKLNFNEHCIHLIRQGGRKINCLLRTSQRTDINFVINMYKVFVRSALEYCSVIYSPYTAKNIDLLESIQKNFVRRIVSHNHHNYEARLRAANLESLSLRRKKRLKYRV